MPTSSPLEVASNDVPLLIDLIYIPDTHYMFPAGAVAIPKIDSEQNAPYLKIEIQPLEKFRFRYGSEKGSHGSLTGVSTPRVKKSFPTVKLENWTSHKNVRIKASLYTADADPKPHILELVGKSCENGVCYQKLDKAYTAKFQSMRILSKKKDEVLNILREKRYPELIRQGLSENEIQNQIQEEAKSYNMNAVQLCFEAIFDEDLNYSPPGCKIYSNVIYNLKSTIAGDLRICRLSKESGKVSGGDEVILLCEKIKKEDIKIEFFEKDENGDIVWEDYAQFSPVDVHHQVAITFKTPKYQGNINEDTSEKTVFIQLLRLSDLKHSEPRAFRYILDNNMRDSKKRKHSSLFEKDLLELSEILNLDMSEVPDLSSQCSFMQDSNLYDFPVQNATSFDEMFSSEKEMDSMTEMFDLNSSFPDIDLIKNAVKFSTGKENVSKLPKPQRQISQRRYPEKRQEQMLTSVSKLKDKRSEGKLDTKFVDDEIPVGEMQDMPTAFISSNYKKDTFEAAQTEYRTKDFSKHVNELFKNKRLLLYGSKSVPVQDENGNSVLHLAILEQNQDLQFLCQLLKMIPAHLVNYKNENNETALHLATARNHFLIVEMLLQCGGNPNLVNLDGNNCFHIACKNKFSLCLKELLKQPKVEKQVKQTHNINSYNFDGLTPLHLCILHNSKECLQLLLNAKADINIRETKCGRTSLHLAVQLRQSLLSDLLVQPDIDVTIEDYQGYTPLQTACEETEEDFESLPSELKSDKRKITSFLLQLCEDASESEDEELNAGNFHSAYENDSKDSENSIDLEFESSIWDILNASTDWRKLGVIANMDDKSLNIIRKLDNNPSKALIDKIKKNQGLGDTKGDLIAILRMVGLQDAIRLVENHQ